MSTIRHRGGLDTELPHITRLDIAAHVREGRRLRDQEIDKLLRKAGRGLARLGRAVAGLVATPGRGIGVMTTPGGLGLGQAAR